jgi:hypothetical protein
MKVASKPCPNSRSIASIFSAGDMGPPLYEFSELNTSSFCSTSPFFALTAIEPIPLLLFRVFIVHRQAFPLTSSAALVAVASPLAWIARQLPALAFLASVRSTVPVSPSPRKHRM